MAMKPLKTSTLRAASMQARVRSKTNSGALCPDSDRADEHPSAQRNSPLSGAMMRCGWRAEGGVQRDKR